MEVARSHKGIFVSQRKYTLDLQTGMLGCKPADTPMDPTSKIQMEEEELMTDKGRYQRLVGKLIYFAHTRLNIRFAVGMVSRYMNMPTKRHLKLYFEFFNI